MLFLSYQLIQTIITDNGCYELCISDVALGASRFKFCDLSKQVNLVNHTWIILEVLEISGQTTCTFKKFETSFKWKLHETF